MSATLAIAAGVVMLGLVAVYVYRLAVGPTVFDRLLGLSGFGTKTTLVLLLIGAGYERLEMFVDLSLAYALLSFVGAIAAARYFDRGGQHR
ncbi:MAG TPA: monovalent cation/H+ antiporter complex subunit F [Terriglobales bacterium]|nr:monovalent cation/H+ antiporter complex subunit F [Terriglobales bacterium]